jgi:hypothetical protein
MIAVFDTGIVRIPPMPVVLQNSIGFDTQYTNDIPLLITGVADSLGLAPIKPIIPEPAKFSDYLPYLIAAALIGILIVLGIIYRRRKPKAQEVVEVRDVKSAHVIAFEKLDLLESEKLWQKGHIKEYHSRMNHIMREYLDERFQIRTLESTSSEIMAQLRSIDLPEKLLGEISDVMEVEDLIKFAKAEPPAEIHAEYLEFARALIRQTKIDTQISEANV